MRRFMWSAVFITVAGLVVVLSPGPMQAEETDDVAAVKQVIESAYINGIHINRDVAAIRAGFHEEFTMVMYNDGKISKMSLGEWVARIEEGKKKNPDPPKVETTYEIPVVEVAGNAAVARIELYKDGKHVFTDFMSLYKFPDGWKIVNKIYYRHPG